MAKVKIQGHASGTGVLTVTAPNTSTDRTITLPDATGTLLNSDGDGSNLTGISAGPFTEVNTHKFTYTTDTNPVLQVIDSTNTVKAQMQGGNTSAVFGSASDHPVDFIQGAGEATRVRINTSGVVSIPNGIELGSGTDATAANTLDDYEEGTFTGTFKDSSGANMNGAVYTTYTKIGNLCTITVYNASWSDVQNGMLEQMTGLPFTAAASVRTVGSLGSYGAPLQDYAQFPVIYPNASSVQFKGSRDNNSWVSHWDVDSNSEFMWTMTYKTV